tara:strand:- start:1159 stop:1386 length:228 start_codon:yes stop_codon:yes gene_type:complete
MTLEPYIIWSGLLSLIITMLGYAFTMLVRKVQENQSKLQDVRENFIRRAELNQEVSKITKVLERLEDKIDKLANK